MLWKIILAVLSLFGSNPTSGPTQEPSPYPREVLEPWGVSDWAYEAGKPQPWEPQTPADKAAAYKALHRPGSDMRRRRRLVENSVRHKDWLWPNKKVYYAISKNIPSQYHELIERAIQQYHNLTCLTFKKRQKEKDFIIFDKLKTESGCFSEVGCIKSGAQIIHLDVGCFYIGTIVHEIGHALGFWHEHQRQDRDKWVKINKTNIERGFEDQFEKTDPKDEILYNGFDYISSMIYGNYAFSQDTSRLKTMEAVDGRQITEPYNKPGLDNSDIHRVECMYCKKCEEYKPPKP